MNLIIYPIKFFALIAALGLLTEFASWQASNHDTKHDGDTVPKAAVVEAIAMGKCPKVERYISSSPGDNGQTWREMLLCIGRADWKNLVGAEFLDKSGAVVTAFARAMTWWTYVIQRDHYVLVSP